MLARVWVGVCVRVCARVLQAKYMGASGKGLGPLIWAQKEKNRTRPLRGINLMRAH